MSSIIRYLPLLLAVLLTGCAGHPDRDKPWLGTLRHELGYLGARNWVVVAEAAFPVHSRRGLSVVQINGEIPVNTKVPLTVKVPAKAEPVF